MFGLITINKPQIQQHVCALYCKVITSSCFKISQSMQLSWYLYRFQVVFTNIGLKWHRFTLNKEFCLLYQWCNFLQKRKTFHLHDLTEICSLNSSGMSWFWSYDFINTLVRVMTLGNKIWVVSPKNCFPWEEVWRWPYEQVFTKVSSQNFCTLNTTNKLEDVL